MTKTIIQKHFKRVETKYLLSQEILADLLADLDQHMVADDFSESTITNIYFDNDNFDMIQDSLAKKHGKKKVRMRLYAPSPTATSQAFLEIKQKIDGVGFKYRLTSTPVSVINYVGQGIADATIGDDKVRGELEQLRRRYGTIKPKMYIYYDRKSFKGRQDKTVRVTIDQNLTYRDYQVTYHQGKHGYPLLEGDKVIMEIKVAGDLPRWLAELLTKHGIEQSSFSKYGNAYKLTQERLTKKEVAYAQSLI